MYSKSSHILFIFFAFFFYDYDVFLHPWNK